VAERLEYALDGGKYLLLDHLADGAGDTRIWFATSAQGDVVVKVIPIPRDPGLLKKKRAYFQDEVECGSSLTGDHILRLLDSGEVQTAKELGHPRGVFYLVFEHIAFGSLRNLFKKGLVSGQEVADLASSVATGLSTAHEHVPRICHRDLKPENILLPDGRCDLAKIADFGIARAEDGTVITSWGGWAGTPRYMAPEQFTDSAHVDHRADIYSLGLILWESLTGQVPYDCGDGRMTMESRLAGGSLVPISAGQRTARALTDVLVQALSKNPDLRPSSVIGFAESIADALRRDRVLRTSSEVMDPESIVEFFEGQGLHVKDNRQFGGALWVMGDESLRPIMTTLLRQGIRFVYKPEGAKATNYRPGWWTVYGREGSS